MQQQQQQNIIIIIIIIIITIIIMTYSFCQFCCSILVNSIYKYSCGKSNYSG